MIVGGARISLAVLALLPAFTSSGAQTSAARVESSAINAATSPAVSNLSSDSARWQAPRLAAVVASGAPRSYQVISVPIPDAFSHSTSVEMAIVTHGDFVILGPRTRSLPTSTRHRIGVTVGVPTGAIAGHSLAADVQFSAQGIPPVTVPIEIDVTLVRQIALRTRSAPINAQAGSDIIVPFEISNTGNAKETLVPELDLPSGWAQRDVHSSPIELQAGETVKKRVRLAIPSLASTGSSFVRVVLRSGGEVLADQTITVDVFNSSSIGRQAGPLITTSVSQANDENGRANSLFTMSATGALFDSVRADARISRGSMLGGAASTAFAHLGSYQSAASLSLTAPSGQLNLGNTGTSFSDLTGLYPYGQGALLRLEHPGWSFTGLGALSVAQPGVSERRPMVGVLGERQFGDARVSTSISHLADAGPSPRKLDAAGIGAAIPTLFGSSFRAEVAERRFADGSGFGWSSGLVRTEPDRDEELRVTHAPGGSDAFARATNEVIANVSEKLTSRASVSAAGWKTTDVTSVFSGLTARGFSLRPQYSILGSTSLSIEARTYDFDAIARPTPANAGGGFGNREQQLGFGVSSTLREYYLNTTAYLGDFTRTVSPAGEPVTADRTPRNYWTTNAGWAGTGGMIEAQIRIEQTRDRGGFVNQQTMVGVRGEQVVLPWLGGVRGEGELQHVSGFGDERSSIVRAGIAVPIANGVALRVDAERNSIFHSVSGRVPWILGLRIEHSLTLPMLRQPGTSGYVYEDRNGNQRRDSGEPGVPGVVVRRGNETAVADANGKYRVGGEGGKPVMIDEASLPDGWTAVAAVHGDLGILLTTAAEIELVVAPRSGIAPVQVDLARARVMARDSSGREWIARMTGPSTATFESLPVGRYTLEFDLSDVSEPLVPRSPIPTLLVTGTDSKSITITLDPRPIRIWKAPKS
jgi:hypothetical protein